ncbi:hypothetical protein Q4577_14065 [Marinovum sp. 2_MG-2023]|nr:hypothetical protein [Marinovum sp. 2_MG-2023]MDO6778651.1 hypothetical protein [Marinovum sp. 1_MG-2023]
MWQDQASIKPLFQRRGPRPFCHATEVEIEQQLSLKLCPTRILPGLNLFQPEFWDCVVTTARIVGPMFHDQGHFPEPNFYLILAFEKDLTADGEILQLRLCEVRFDAGIVPASKVSDCMPIFADVLANVDFSVWESDLVNNLSELPGHSWLCLTCSELTTVCGPASSFFGFPTATCCCTRIFNQSGIKGLRKWEMVGL